MLPLHASIAGHSGHIQSQLHSGPCARTASGACGGAYPPAHVGLRCTQDALEVVLEDGGVQRRLPLDSALLEASAALHNRDLDRCMHKCITV